MRESTNDNGNLFGDSAPSGQRIRQIREMCGMTQTELAEKIGVSQGLIAQVEGSFKFASAEMVHKIAVQTKRFQPSFFYSEPPVTFPVESVMFRSMASTTRTQETEARRYAEIVCELAMVLLRNIKPLGFKLELHNISSPSDAAQRVRARLEISKDQPIEHLLQPIENSGVLVLALPMELPKRDALSLGSSDIGMPIIALSSARAGDRLRMSAAHELGHIVLKHSKIAKAKEEQQAYDFASELLMPESPMRLEMVAPVTLSLIVELKRRWRVSIQSLIRRGSDLGILDESRSKYLYTQVSVKGWRKKEPVEIPVERPRLLRQLTELAYGNSIVRLANELRFKPDFVHELLDCYEPDQRGDPKLHSKVIALRKR